MAIRPVLKMGHPILRQVALPVTQFGPELQTLLADMDETMRSLHGAGLAAPQIGVSQRIVIFELKENPRYPHVTPGSLHHTDQPTAHAARRRNE